jgi:hypothetical protein
MIQPSGQRPFRTPDNSSRRGPDHACGDTLPSGAQPAVIPVAEIQGLRSVRVFLQRTHPSCQFPTRALQQTSRILIRALGWNALTELAALTRTGAATRKDYGLHVHSTPRWLVRYGECSPPGGCSVEGDTQAEHRIRALPAWTLGERETAPARGGGWFNPTLWQGLPEYPHRDSCHQSTRAQYRPCQA